MKKQAIPEPPPIRIGDVVAFLMGSARITGVVAEIRSDNKAVIKRDGKIDIVRAVAFLEHAPAGAAP